MEKSSLRGWLVVMGMALLFVCWGLFLFFVVGDKGPPPWDFGVVKDIPGEAPHSSVAPGPAGPPAPQHVDR